MQIVFYISLFSVLLLLILSLKKTNRSNDLIFYIFCFFYLLISFRVNNINEDALNYKYYFNYIGNVKTFQTLFTSPVLNKVEIGFKLLVYSISIFSFENNIFIYKICFTLIPLCILFYLYKKNKEIDSTFIWFIFFYISFFIYFFDFAIIRFSVSTFLFIVAYYSLIYKKNAQSAIIFILLASMFHYAAALFSIIFLLTYMLLYHVKQKKLILFLLFIFIILSKSILYGLSSHFGSYYASLLSNTQIRVSIRLFAELFLILLTYKSLKNITTIRTELNLIITLYLIVSFIEFYYGIYVLNRFRAIVWFVFLFFLSKNWKYINLKTKYINVIYALIFYAITCVSLIKTWK